MKLLSIDRSLTGTGLLTSSTMICARLQSSGRQFRMSSFIRFSEEEFRDDIVANLQSAEGVIWSDYRVKVKGYSLDAQVKLIRLLGVSPDT